MQCSFRTESLNKEIKLNKKLLIIAGPTAVGKTSLSISLAKKLNGEIVSADSMQIYKELNIGTAKPGDDEKEGIPHHMIDICSPESRFSVAQYVKEAGNCIKKIHASGKLPIIVGGTGLYIDNLIHSNDFGDFDIDIEIREKLMKESIEFGNESLLKKLYAFDPEYASKLHVNDTKRIVHALEIFYATGKTHSQIIADSRKKPSEYDFLYCVLNCSSRELLYDRINLRVDKMMKNGLLEEAKKVVSSDWYKGSTASQAIGYKEFEAFFSGDASLDSCVELLKQRSRNYAKRQLTWFRHRDEARFYNVDLLENIEDTILNDFEMI